MQSLHNSRHALAPPVSLEKNTSGDNRRVFGERGPTRAPRWNEPLLGLFFLSWGSFGVLGGKRGLLKATRPETRAAKAYLTPLINSCVIAGVAAILSSGDSDRRRALAFESIPLYSPL